MSESLSDQDGQLALAGRDPAVRGMLLMNVQVQMMNLRGAYVRGSMELDEFEQHLERALRDEEAIRRT